MTELYLCVELQSVGTPTLWGVTIAGIVALLIVDFLVTRRPHEVSIREALAWSGFYVALPLAFGAWLWYRYGSRQGVEYLTGYLVEKSLSVDNLFVFMLLLAAFAVPSVLAQRVLLFGITGALVLRAVFIALGAAALQTLDFAFLLFALILLVTAAKLLRDAMSGHEQQVDINGMRAVRAVRKFMPVTDDYQGTKMIVRRDGRRALTPLALVVVAVLATDVVFAVDSVPAVYGITEDPYLVFATNAFALLGLRALYFVLHAALSRLVHLNYGLAIILAFIGVKLGLHWAHGIWKGVPEIPTLASLGVIIGVLVVVTLTSLYVTRTSRSNGGGQGTIVNTSGGKGESR
ncbi:TerC/Alx family metal homeostasis membrane protein [Salinispora arenicola]|uniref:Tellurium resistance protein TerC n=2 Tax=Salinispora arenicola TaxID=168697 RepID=A0A542XSN8_SALAC|nr:TerC/Alx family metal homeostasis membrane protein [Salinispora arenicola]MCN0151264.1 TerC/Alx family metal homeostasis membrane protein [Salinispora arenicola]MCN0176708.1 TerC/Alx family metal homeostasis membrane protein [Salinispora arenicola]NIL41223.1 TerC/Alx family metal homeostasis membrane protein [Salinispora arenicola]NIL58416.1 TerC/Alx family metal homeostasis membrane protein [Salinispora arenicola]NIL62279.1 TerC/Alx family metal homeostasis membrane protein [Salinispora ar